MLIMIRVVTMCHYTEILHYCWLYSLCCTFTRVTFSKCKSDHVIPLLKITFTVLGLKSKNHYIQDLHGLLLTYLCIFGSRLSVTLWGTEKAWLVCKHSAILFIGLKYHPFSLFPVNCYSSFRTLSKHYFLRKPAMITQTRSHPNTLDLFFIALITIKN